MITVEVVKDSTAPCGVRLTTLCLTYPRFAHAELMTHRVFSRNASSSRAIPVAKQIQMVRDNPAIPIAFTRNKAGMQGGAALTGDEHEAAVRAWLVGRDDACRTAEALAALEVHKQYANRVIEPWAHISVVVTSTQWENFWALRWHKDALPEMQEIARQHWVAMVDSRPEKLDAGDWHLPYIDDEDVDLAYDKAHAEKSTDPAVRAREILIQQSAARCARVSYLTHEGSRPEITKDLELYARLVGSAPMHASPAEHQAMAVGDPGVQSGNFRGWIQHRKTLKNECAERFSPPEAMFDP